jgi:DNA-binding NarL/FixJ family response regulator
MSIKILIADDHRILREGLRRVIEKDAGLKVIAEAVDGQSAVTLARELSPDVVIMDITMPGLNGIEATRRILSEAPNIKILALSMHSDEQFVVAMLKAGASGYFLKECGRETAPRYSRCCRGGNIFVLQNSQYRS